MSVLTIKEQYKIINKIVAERVNNIIPSIMEQRGHEMWLVMCKEYNEEPIFEAITPANYPTARRISMFAFINKNGNYKAISLSMPDLDLETLYTRYWNFKEETQANALQRLIKEYNPKNIVINSSKNIAFSDGISNGCYLQLLNMIGDYPAENIIRDDYLAMRTLEMRTPTELEYLPVVVNLAYKIIESVFSKESIIPGKTTCEDLEYLFRQKTNDLGLHYWFEPTVDIQRKKNSNPRYYGIIEKGDLLHCDYGLRYLRICTDTQRLCYVLNDNETDIPAFMKAGMKVNDRFQDIVSECMEVNKTGNDVLVESLDKAKSENIEAILYTHPCNFYGHGPGTTIGLFNQQTPIAIKGDFELIDETTFALELNTAFTHDNQKWYFYTEETILFKDNHIQYLYPGRDHIYLVGKDR